MCQQVLADKDKTMETKKDLRVTKTYTALSNTFWELIQKKTFSEITVNELCNRALIRRQTFYKHFTDKYDFLSFMILSTLQQNKKEGPDWTRTDSAEETLDHFLDHLMDSLRQVMELIDIDHDLLENIGVGNHMFIVIKNVMRSIDGEIQDFYEKALECGCRLPSDTELLTHFLIGSIHQSVLYWYMNRNSISKESFLERISKLIKEIFSHAVS